jgi:hypothetical protein
VLRTGHRLGYVCDAGVVGAVVLVEGSSDEAAVRALAARLGRDVDVEAVGGAGGFARAVRGRDDERFVGLVDVGEVPQAELALDRAGLLGRVELHVCDLDLEDELIRALGAEAVEAIVLAAGEERMFRTFQDQPFQRERPLDAQLRRFLGTKSGRKIRYGQLLVEALPLVAVPRPLAELLAAV